MEKLKSEGKCVFCEKTYKQAGIGRHLMSHLIEKEKEYTGKKKGDSFLIKVKAAEMFLMLWIDEKTTYRKLDKFLRDIWVECCGHMSEFIDISVRKQQNSSKKQMTEMLLKGVLSKKTFNFNNSPVEIKKATRISNTYEKGKKIQYDYDFGSTTRLDIVLVDKINIPASKPIVLLSRNEPLEIMCHRCGEKSAIEICSVHYELFCEDCVPKHKKECSDFNDYASMPVVNSPRMGVCGYDGGSIDTERDGVFKI